MINGKTVLERKTFLARLVADHLASLGHAATVVKGRINSKGHIDRVLVDSSIGLVHITASVGREPNGKIPTADYEDGSQSFLADKDFVAYGWSASGDRIIIMFVPIVAVLGHRALSKNQIRDASTREYNTVIKGLG